MIVHIYRAKILSGWVHSLVLTFPEYPIVVARDRSELTSTEMNSVYNILNDGVRDLRAMLTANINREETLSTSSSTSSEL